MPLIKLEKIYRAYPLGDSHYQALNGVTLSVSAGEALAIMGASGSGKTSLMNIIGFLDRPDRGQYWFDGQNVSQLNRDARATLRNQTIGFIFQSFHLLDRLTALENVMLPLRYAGEASESHLEAKSRACLAAVGMDRYAAHHPNALSGGQRQRVAIARALVNDPAVLLADEPTGALDSRTSEQVLEVLLNHRGKRTLIMITHDQTVASHCPRTVHISDGQVSYAAT